MSDISKKPWKMNVYEGIIIDADQKIILNCFDSALDAEHIVKCVNEHDGLIAKIDILKKSNDRCQLIRNEQISETEQLKRERKTFVEYQVWLNYEIIKEIDKSEIIIKENKRLKEVLLHLTNQITINDYEDSLGHKMKMNSYYHDSLKILEDAKDE